MSNRDRLLVAAAAIAVTVCAMLWAVVAVARLVDAGAEGAQAAALANSNDASQRLMALATVFQAVVGVVGLAGLCATVVYASLAWRAARDQATTARLALENLERPYVFVGLPTDIDRFRSQGRDADGEYHSMSRHFTYTLTNYGRSPAVVREVKMRSCLASSADDAFKKLNGILSRTWFAGTEALIPQNESDERSGRISVRMTAAEDEAYNKRGSQVFLCVLGRVHYEDVTGAEFTRHFMWYDVRGVVVDGSLQEFGETDYNYDERVPPED